MNDLVKPVGFMVWNPESGMVARPLAPAGAPHYVHSTLERALREAERLTRAHPGQRFYVMAPVLGDADAGRAKSLCDGMREGYEQAKREVMRAEHVSDALSDTVFELRRAMDLLRHSHAAAAAFAARAEYFQSVVADAQCWFDGYLAAHAGQDGWQRPWTPDTGKLRELNEALRRCLPAAVSDDEIPF